MKFLCLAYGKEADWVALPEERREELLRQDDVLRQRGAFISVVGDPLCGPGTVRCIGLRSRTRRRTPRSEVVGGWVPRLVEHDRVGAGDLHHRDQTEALVGDGRGERRPLGL